MSVPSSPSLIKGAVGDTPTRLAGAKPEEGDSLVFVSTMAQPGSSFTTTPLPTGAIGGDIKTKELIRSPASPVLIRYSTAREPAQLVGLDTLHATTLTTVVQGRDGAPMPSSDGAHIVEGSGSIPARPTTDPIALSSPTEGVVPIDRRYNNERCLRSFLCPFERRGVRDLERDLYLAKVWDLE